MQRRRRRSDLPWISHSFAIFRGEVVKFGTIFFSFVRFCLGLTRVAHMTQSSCTSHAKIENVTLWRANKWNWFTSCKTTNQELQRRFLRTVRRVASLVTAPWGSADGCCVVTEDPILTFSLQPVAGLLHFPGAAWCSPAFLKMNSLQQQIRYKWHRRDNFVPFTFEII